MKVDPPGPGMAEPARPESVGDGAVLRHRLRAASRLLSLLAEQLDARTEGDTARCGRLAVERDLVVAEVAGLSGRTREGAELEEIAGELGHLVEEASGALKGRPEEDQRIPEWVGSWHGTSLRLPRRAPARPGVGSGYRIAGSVDRRINVRF